jgi:hypothetical protein
MSLPRRREALAPWDLQPGSTMTNATVTTVTSGPNERTMILRYKNGEKTIRVPNGIPVVTTKAGDKSLLVVGAKVILTGQMQNGQPVEPCASWLVATGSRRRCEGRQGHPH